MKVFRQTEVDVEKAVMKDNTIACYRKVWKRLLTAQGI
jgi:hypothetical protein